MNQFLEAFQATTVGQLRGSLVQFVEALQRPALTVLQLLLEPRENDSDGLHFEPCYDEPMCVVVGAHHPLAERSGLRLADLGAAAWILPLPETAYRQRIDAAFRNEGVDPPAQLVESVSILTNTMLLQETDMLGVLPYNVARHYVAAGSVRVLDVRLPEPSGPVGMITLAGLTGSPVVEPLLEALRGVAATMRN